MQTKKITISTSQGKMVPPEYNNRFITCPTCFGKGYCDEDEYRISNSLIKETPFHAKRSLRLPAIGFENTIARRNFSSYGTEFHSSKDIGDVHLPAILHSNASYTGRNGSGLHKKNTLYSGGDNLKAQDKSLLAEPAKFERPQDALKLALLKLKLNQWDSTMQALVNIVQISRFQPELIDPSMPIINRSICSLLKNIRSSVARTACQVAEELFRTIQCFQRPAFDELVGILLQKTADMNKFIRQDANQALDAMADHIPSSHCIRVLASSRGAGHKNPLVRATVSRLLNYIVDATGVEPFLSTTTPKDTRSSVFLMCAKFLVDGNSETRGNARTLVKHLMTHNDFEHQFNQEVDRKLIETIKKQLICLKYDAPSSSQIPK